MSGHSKIGASTCERWWNCPGSVRLVEQCPPQKESPYAKEGTAAHELAQLCLESGFDAVDFVGQISKGEIEFSNEMAEAVQMYLDVIRFDMATYDLTIKDIKIEHKFHLSHIDKQAYGTNDCNLPVFLDKVIVYDYKHGQGVAVDAEENKQLLYYALGAAELGDYETIEVVIVQPRAIHADGPVRRWTISAADLSAFGIELKARIAITRESEASLISGNWCKKTFCPAMAICPAIRKKVENDAMVVFDKPVVNLPKPGGLSPDALKTILEGMPLMEDWLKAIWAYAEMKANNGEKIKGFKLVQGRKGSQKWSDEGRPVTFFQGEFGDKIYDIKLKSPSAMEKVVGKKKLEQVKNLIIRTEGKVILVPEIDPREAVQPTTTLVFEKHENDIFN